MNRHAFASIALVAAVAAVTVVPSVLGQPGIGVLAALVIVGLTLWRRRTGPRALGFTAPASWSRTIVLGIVLGALIQAASVMLLDPLFERMTGQALDLSQFDHLRGNIKALLGWLAVVWVLVVFVEEIVFRGFLMNELKGLLGTGRGALVANLLLTSVLFGLAHWYQGPAGVLSTGLVGLLLGVAFAACGWRLWLPILVHGCIDTVGLTLIYADADRWLAGL